MFLLYHPPLMTNLFHLRVSASNPGRADMLSLIKEPYFPSHRGKCRQTRRVASLFFLRDLILFKGHFLSSLFLVASRALRACMVPGSPMKRVNGCRMKSLRWEEPVCDSSVSTHTQLFLDGN